MHTPKHPGYVLQRQDELPGISFGDVAENIGVQIAEGIMQRIHEFPARERLLSWKAGRMDSLPEDILWEGLGIEAPAIFVVYKLIHEAFSNAPQFFRAALVAFMRAQPRRFRSVFNREIIWSAVAGAPGFEAPALPSLAEISERLAMVQRKGIWWRSADDIRREAQWVHSMLAAAPKGFQHGFVALRSMQTEKGFGIAAGNLLLPVPGRLAAYAEEVVSHGRAGSLPEPEGMYGRIDEFARDHERDSRHVSIPIDLLYTTTEDDNLHVRILVRAKAAVPDRAEIRRRSLYLRYFLRRAFAGYKAQELDIKLAFYLDSSDALFPWHGSDSLFHPDEWLDREKFWNELCPGADPDDLFQAIRTTAAKALSEQKIVDVLKKHFSRDQSAGHPR